MPHRIPTYRPLGMSRQREYDRFSRDRESKRFYHTAAWLKARLMQLRAHPLCHDCLLEGRTTAASHVHHIKELADAPDLALDPTNHRSLCHACHSRVHHAARATPTPDASACTSGLG